MNKTVFTIIIALLSSFNVFSSVVISGKFVNAKSRLVMLDYSGSSYMTSPNFFGLKQMSTFLDDKNEFKFIIETPKDYCVYNLDRFEILVKDNDSISIYVDFNDVDKSFIAKGRGVTLTNLWFAVDLFNPKRRPNVSNEKVIEYWNKQKQCYSDVLNAFKLGLYSKSDNLSNGQTSNINRLIKGSFITSLEYNLIQNRINYSCISSAISCTKFEYLKANHFQYFQLFKNINLLRNTIINDYITENFVDKYVQLTCLKKESKVNETITEEEFYKYYFENTVVRNKNLKS